MNTGNGNGASRRVGLSGCTLLERVHVKLKISLLPIRESGNKKGMFSQYMELHGTYYKIRTF